MHQAEVEYKEWYNHDHSENSAAEAMIKKIGNRLLCQTVWFSVQTELEVTR